MTDEKTIVVRWSFDRLIPVSEWDSERLHDLPQGVNLECKIRRDRSLAMHRFFFVLLGVVVENNSFFKNINQLLEWLKVKLGYVEWVAFPHGEMWPRTKSISFAKMDQEEFRAFFEQSVAAILSEVLPGTTSQSLIQQVESLLGISYEGIWVKP